MPFTFPREADIVEAEKLVLEGQMMKKVLKSIGILLLAVLLLVLAYLAYVLIDYHRIGDQTLPVTHVSMRQPELGQSYDIVSWNIGFGAYESDYGFFMDGGDQSRAWSKERLEANLETIGRRLAGLDADLLLVQEVDTDATRSYHVEEYEALQGALQDSRAYSRVFAQNYDSPYLLYPLSQPHGASQAGLATFADFGIDFARWVELPIETGFTKFLDLDRCYSRSLIPMEDGRDLVLYNLHLSAYTSDGSIATEQLKLLLADMQAEYEAGNYCVAGGDFNKDLLGDSGKYFGASDKEYTWAQPIPPESFDGCDIRLVAPLDADAPVPSCRNADGPYHPGQYVLTVDGFLVSPNVQVEESQVLDDGFACSDHNPVRMRFTLLGDE